MRDQKLYTLEEVAERIHKTKRWLREYLRLHPYYRKAGRTILMTELDVAQLLASFEPRSLIPNARPRSRSVSFRSAEDTVAEALALCREKKNERNRKKPKRSRPAGG